MLRFTFKPLIEPIKDIPVTWIGDLKLFIHSCLDEQSSASLIQRIDEHLVYVITPPVQKESIKTFHQIYQHVHNRYLEHSEKILLLAEIQRMACNDSDVFFEKIDDFLKQYHVPHSLSTLLDASRQQGNVSPLHYLSIMSGTLKKAFQKHLQYGAHQVYSLDIYSKWLSNLKDIFQSPHDLNPEEYCVQNPSGDVIGLRWNVIGLELLKLLKKEGYIDYNSDDFIILENVFLMQQLPQDKDAYIACNMLTHTDELGILLKLGCLTSLKLQSKIISLHLARHSYFRDIQLEHFMSILNYYDAANRQSIIQLFEDTQEPKLFELLLTTTKSGNVFLLERMTIDNSEICEIYLHMFAMLTEKQRSDLFFEKDAKGFNLLMRAIKYHPYIINQLLGEIKKLPIERQQLIISSQDKLSNNVLHIAIHNECRLSIEMLGQYCRQNLPTVLPVLLTQTNQEQLNPLMLCCSLSSPTLEQLITLYQEQEPSTQIVALNHKNAALDTAWLLVLQQKKRVSIELMFNYISSFDPIIAQEMYKKTNLFKQNSLHLAKKMSESNFIWLFNRFKDTFPQSLPGLLIGIDIHQRNILFYAIQENDEIDLHLLEEIEVKPKGILSTTQQGVILFQRNSESCHALDFSMKKNEAYIEPLLKLLLKHPCQFDMILSSLSGYKQNHEYFIKLFLSLTKLIPASSTLTKQLQKHYDLILDDTGFIEGHLMTLMSKIEQYYQVEFFKTLMHQLLRKLICMPSTGYFEVFKDFLLAHNRDFYKETSVLSLEPDGLNLIKFAIAKDVSEEHFQRLIKSFDEAFLEHILSNTSVDQMNCLMWAIYKKSALALPLLNVTKTLSLETQSTIFTQTSIERHNVLSLSLAHFSMLLTPLMDVLKTLDISLPLALSALHQDNFILELILNTFPIEKIFSTHEVLKKALVSRQENLTSITKRLVAFDTPSAITLISQLEYYEKQDFLEKMRPNLNAALLNALEKPLSPFRLFSSSNEEPEAKRPKQGAHNV